MQPGDRELTPAKEDASLILLKPVAEELLASWLAEFYGKPVQIAKRELLRHRDLSYVERLYIADGLPASLIYKLVLPPWDIEQDLHERILIPSISNSSQLYLSAHQGPITALFLEDLGTESLLECESKETATLAGTDLAKMHRAYSYRTDELMHIGVLRTLSPLDYVDFTAGLIGHLKNWQLISVDYARSLLGLARLLAGKLAGEPTSLVHGDLFAENIILRGEKLFIIDWSWFTILGVPLMDVATLTMAHAKNGKFSSVKQEVIESYCFESARDPDDVIKLLPHAESLSRLLFLHWLIERRSRGILGTTVGPVDALIQSVVKELSDRLAKAEE